MGQAFYSPLSRVEKKDKVYNVVAVVTSAGFISQTSTGGKYACLRTICDDVAYSL